MEWDLKAELLECLQKETGYRIHPAGSRIPFAIVYPNSYHVGMSNLGIHILYDLLNKRGDTACERFFLPDRRSLEKYRRTKTALMSLETQTPLHRFGIVAFALSFEMDYFNVLEILKLGKVALLSEKRGERDPLVIAGGPCATFNPEPLSLFVDAFIIGEGEVILPDFMEAFLAAKSRGLSRKELLLSLSGVPGVYVPSLYEHRYDGDGRIQAILPMKGAPSAVKRRWVKHLDEYPAHTVIVTEDTELNLYLVETARGCGRHCRFCMAGYCFRRPRNRSLSFLLREIQEAASCGKRIGLMGAAISDYPEIDSLCRGILEKGLSMSVASFRADSVTEELVRALAKSGLKTLTMAPEAGSRRMRAVINKGIEEHHLFTAMELGLKAGIQNYRLYIMIGLPYERDEDGFAVIDLANRLKNFMEERGGRGTLTLSINPFVPKPFTPFQWMPMAPRRNVERRLKAIQSALRGRKGIHIIAESLRDAYLQGVLARGDRRVSEALLRAFEQDDRGLKRSMKECGILPEFYLYRERSKGEIFPWECLDMGFRREYLYEEAKRAEHLQATSQCFDECRRCGVC